MERQLFLQGKFQNGGNQLDVMNKFSGSFVSKAHLATKENFDTAISHAEEIFEQTKKLPTWQKQKALRHISKQLKENSQTIAATLCMESGKPMRYALGEVDRAVTTFQFAADILMQWHGEIIPLDVSPAAGNRFGLVKRFPIGPVLGISPFNFPLNLAAHKIAPAIAVGNPIILKPASATPLSAFYIADFISETDLPEGILQILPSDRDVANLVIADERIKMLTFTGSAEVGWKLKAKAGKKKIALELGGNAGVYIGEDADINNAINRCLIGAFAYSGQVCISVQKIFLHESIAEEFTKRFVERTMMLKTGDPLSEETEIGPMIDEKNAVRIIEWIKEAVDQGAKILCGGNREEKLVYPTIMQNVPLSCPLSGQEAFGPVVNIETVRSNDEAIQKINSTRYGLQAGIFTNNQKFIFDAFEQLDVGGVIVNDVPTFRVDNMPYGGVKDSGFGREGLRYTMEEMTELKHLAINRNV